MRQSLPSRIVERKIRSSHGSYVIVAYEDGTVAIEDEKHGLFITGWPMTVTLPASTVQSRTDAELSAWIATIIGRRKTPQKPL